MVATPFLSLFQESIILKLDLHTHKVNYQIMENTTNESPSNSKNASFCLKWLF
jgi:hypothetical protein